jgi:hypothetical protein
MMLNDAIMLYPVKNVKYYYSFLKKILVKNSRSFINFYFSQKKHSILKRIECLKFKNILSLLLNYLF